MQRKLYLFPIFIICLSLAGLLLLFSRFGWLFFLENSIQDVIFPVGLFVRSATIPKTQDALQKLQAENTALAQKQVNILQLQQDNAALRDQFEITTISSKNLLPARVVGMPGAVPNISFPNEIILNKGSKDGVIKGMSVIVTNQLIAIITATSNHFAKALLVTAKESSLSVKDMQTGAIGVARGSGNGEILVDNVLLSDTLHSGDSIVSLGSQNLSGAGVAPGLILGKIVSVDKKPSNLFQSAEVVPYIAFDRLANVFILTQ